MYGATLFCVLAVFEQVQKLAALGERKPVPALLMAEVAVASAINNCLRVAS